MNRYGPVGIGIKNRGTIEKGKRAKNRREIEEKRRRTKKALNVKQVKVITSRNESNNKFSVHFNFNHLN